MKARHVTTLENAPADFLIHGSAALQGYEADCFAMGLCLLHLLTGRAPYEELFAGLTCPPELADALRAAWASAPEHDVTREHLEGDDDNGAVLADTLYRYVCMFGGLADGATRKRGASTCAVWAALAAWHGTARMGRHGAARPFLLSFLRFCCALQANNNFFDHFFLLRFTKQEAFFRCFCCVIRSMRAIR